jgi:hypothetical protein
MERTLTMLLVLALAVGMLASLAGTAAAQPDLLLQTDDLGPLLELIVSLFDISISIEG